MRVHWMITGVALLALPTLAGAQTQVRAEGSAELAAEAGEQGTHAGGHTDRGALRAHTRLRVAREAIERGGNQPRSASEAEVVAGAEALAAGAFAADLQRLRDAAPERRSLTTSLHALAELRGRGIAGAEAASAIAARLRSGASDPDIASFAASVRSAAQLGLGGAHGVSGAPVATGTLGGAAGGMGASLGAGASLVASLGGGILR